MYQSEVNGLLKDNIIEAFKDYTKLTAFFFIWQTIYTKVPSTKIVPFSKFGKIN